MAIPARYRALYNKIVQKYDKPVFDAIQGQIKFFVEQYRQGVINYDLPKRELALTLFNLHKDAAKPIAFYNYNKIVSRKMTRDEVIDFMLAEYFRTQSISKINDITETTRKQIRKILEDGNADGLGVSRIASNLLGSVTTRQRAMLITRTESTTGANIGAMTGAAATGIATKKEWLSANDNRTRRLPRDRFDHLGMDGVAVGYSQMFEVRGKLAPEMMEFPGDPRASASNLCNCRCTIAFVPIRDASGTPIPIDAYPFDNSSIFISLFRRSQAEENLQLIINQIINQLESL